MNNPLFSDSICERPLDFTVPGGRRYYLWPLTLAKTLRLAPLLADIGLADAIKGDGGTGWLDRVLQAVGSHRPAVVRTLALLTARNSAADFHDENAMQARQEDIARLYDTDLATLLTAALRDHTALLMADSGISAERSHLEAALKVRRPQPGNLTFGAVTVLGAMVVPLMEMGMTFEEVMYQRSLILLKLLLADRQVQLLLTDEELADLRGATGALIDGDAPGGDDRLRAWATARGLHVH